MSDGSEAVRAARATVERAEAAERAARAATKARAEIEAARQQVALSRAATIVPIAPAWDTLDRALDALAREPGLLARVRVAEATVLPVDQSGEVASLRLQEHALRARIGVLEDSLEKAVCACAVMQTRIAALGHTRET